MTAPTPLPRRDAYTSPPWWQSYIAEFPRWHAWHNSCQFWARLPGTMLVCHADDPAELARKIRTAEPKSLADRERGADVAEKSI